jgi:hypothetical protein
MSYREQTIQEVEQTLEKALTVKESDISQMKIGDIEKILTKELVDLGIDDEGQAIRIKGCIFKGRICVDITINIKISVQ